VTVGQNFLKKELVLDSIVGRHEDQEEVLLWIKMVMFRDLFVPFLEFVSLQVDSLLVDISGGVEISLILRNYLLKEDSKFTTV